MNMRELEDKGKVMALAAYGHPADEAHNPLIDQSHQDGQQHPDRAEEVSPDGRSWMCQPLEAHNEHY